MNGDCDGRLDLAGYLGGNDIVDLTGCFLWWPCEISCIER